MSATQLMKDLVTDQRAAYHSARENYVKMMFHLNQARIALRRDSRAALAALAKKQAEEKAVLRQKQQEARVREKEEKAFVSKCAAEPAFWTIHPNHDGRRDTMAAVLQSLGMPLDHLDKFMPAYAEWLLTADRARKNRWVLMTEFVNMIKA